MKTAAMLAVTLAIFVASARPVLANGEAEATYSPAIIKADLDELYATLKAAHYDLFARRAQEEYDQYYLDLRKRINAPMTRTQVQVAFQAFMAYGNVAHAQIPLPWAEFSAFIEEGGHILPFGIHVTGDQIFIVDQQSGIDALADGVELLAVDGEPALDWLTHLERYISADHPPLAHGLAEYWLSILAWLEYSEPENFTIRVRDATGKAQEFTVPLRTRESIRATRKAQAEPGLAVDFSTREMRLLENGIAYLRPGPFYNTESERSWDETGFRAFINDAFKKILAAHATDLIIDLRDNPGGDKSFSDLMIAWFADRDFEFYSSFEFKVSELTRKAILDRLETYKDLPEDSRRIMERMAEIVRTHENGKRAVLEMEKATPRPAPRFEGRIYALINRHSYSNATAVAALLKDYGFATLLGEATTDIASSYGAAENFTLSRTGIAVHYPKSWFVRPNGDADLHGVTPDVPIPSPIIETANDQVLEAAVKYIQSRQ